MKVIGVFLVGVSIFLIFRERVRSEERRVLFISELCRFIEKTRIEISCYLKPMEKIPCSFSSALLSEIKFLEIAEKGDLQAAYKEAEKKILLHERERKLFQHFFANIGHGYADDELKLIDGTLGELKDILAREEAELYKKRKLFLTLSVSLSLAIVILLI